MRWLYLLMLFPWSLFSLSEIETQKIAEKIWHNECNGTFEGLTHWNEGENFGSFGIGHFIWYPKGVQECYEETFPDLISFISEQETFIPGWLKLSRDCPWSTKAEFQAAFNTPQMTELRQFLYETRAFQALFIAQRLENKLPDHLIFEKLKQDPRGLYALIDYLNFKGAGTDEKERYKNEGWGLIQVLDGIGPNSTDLVAAFVESAQKVLINRVKNAPPERHEERWLKGWLNRVNTYTNYSTPIGK